MKKELQDKLQQSNQQIRQLAQEYGSTSLGSRQDMIESIQDRRWKLTFAVLGGSALTSAIVTWLFRRRAKRACM